MHMIDVDFFELGRDAAIIAAALAVTKLLQFVVLKCFLRFSRWFHWQLNESMEAYGKRPLLFLIGFITVAIALHFTSLPDSWMARSELALRIFATASAGWLTIGVARGIGDWLEKRYAAREIKDPLGQRRFTTQIQVLMRVVVTVIIVLTLIGIALVIPGLRQVGMSLFASAGVAGVIIGVAANSALSSLIAGVQLALTQPILLGDDVVVNNQQGTIEEISSSYVVVRMGDLRRMIVPLNYFMQNAFENWTYHDPALLGSALFYTGYTIDLEAMRQELTRIAEASKKWNRKSCTLSVNNCKDQLLEIKALVSAANASDLGDLQAEVREKMVMYLQQSQPEALPRMHFSLQRNLAS
jgi:small-conductance mechanosensitive channel